MSIYATYGDADAPTITGMTANTTRAGGTAQFNFSVSDNIGLDFVIPSSNNSGSWANASAIPVSGTSSFALWNLTLNTILRNTVAIKIYVNDTSGNSGISSQYNVTTMLEDGEIFGDEFENGNSTWVNTPYGGSTIQLSSLWSYDGSYSARLNGSTWYAAMMNQTNPSTTILVPTSMYYVYCWAKWNTFVGSGSGVFEFRKTGDFPIAFPQIQNGYWQLDWFNLTNPTHGIGLRNITTVQPQANTVYKVVMGFQNTSTTHINLFLWIDDALIATLSFDESASYISSWVAFPDTIYCGMTKGEYPMTSYVYVDDIGWGYYYPAINPSATTCSLTINSTPISVEYTINSTSPPSGYSVTASSGSASDIQAAVNTVVSAGEGTVCIPIGDWICNQTGTGAINISLAGLTNGSWLNIIGSYSNVTALTNTGQSRTMPAVILRSNITNTGQAYELSTFNVEGAANKHIRISGIAILGNISSESHNNNGIHMHLVDGFLIDHCYIDSGSDGDIFLHMCKGVISHCSIDQTYGLSMSQSWGYGIPIFGNSALGSSSTWVANLSDILGQYDWIGYPYTAGPIYIEYSEFNHCRHAITSAQYGYYVARFNSFETPLSAGMMYVDIHGYGYPAGRGAEVYNNTFYNCGMGIDFRGGGGVVFNNTFISITASITMSSDGGTIDNSQNVHDFWVWGNVFSSSGNYIWFNVIDYRPSVDFFSDINAKFLNGSYAPPTSIAPPKPSYVPYACPHPLTVSDLYGGTTNATLTLEPNIYSVTVPSQVASGSYTYNFTHWQDASTNATITFSLTTNTVITATYMDITTVLITITLPTNTTYDTTTISVSFMASGGTIDQKWFNVKNGTTWVYASNQTYPELEMPTGFINGTSYTFYGWANNTDGTIGVATVMFSVQIPIQPTGGTNQLIVNVWWSSFW
jgi:hypothetical protein